MTRRDPDRVVVIACCAALTLVLGPIHAFSVLVPGWEGLDGADRASVSLIYSVALASLTVAVLFGHRLYARLTPATVFLLAGAGAAAGLASSALAPSLPMLYACYGLLFGGANGLGYGYALQLAGQAAPRRRGLAMGLVTAFYAVGATAAPPLLARLIDAGGNERALLAAAALVAGVAALAAAALHRSGARYESEPAASASGLPAALARVRALLWLGYGSAVAAGLTVISQAYGIASWKGLEIATATLAPTVIAFGNMLGGFSAGYLADRFSSGAMLRWLPSATAFGLLLLGLPVGDERALGTLGFLIVGYCYGALIAVYPVAVVDRFGVRAAPRVYGQVFTAWGLAGVLGPWASGALFDRTASYVPALTLAALLSAVAAVAARRATRPLGER